MNMQRAFALFWTILSLAGLAMASDDALTSGVRYETVLLAKAEVPTTVVLAYRPAVVTSHPVILMLGSIETGKLPFWSEDLVNEGYMLAAFSAAHPPDPDPARRPQWLVFDERFAHSYVEGGYNAARDTAHVIDCLITRGDVHPEKIGWMGSSSTAIPGLAVATREPRLTAIVAFVATGAYKQWLDTWEPNGLTRGNKLELWPKTRELLVHDPIQHVNGLFPKAVLMISGGNDKVVDPATARAFFDAASPHYQSDPERLRLVIYHGFGHNLPRDIIKMYTESWFHLYMHPSRPAPPPSGAPQNLGESVVRTQINAADHKGVVGAK